MLKLGDRALLELQFWEFSNCGFGWCTDLSSNNFMLCATAPRALEPNPALRWLEEVIRTELSEGMDPHSSFYMSYSLNSLGDV